VIFLRSLFALDKRCLRGCRQWVAEKGRQLTGAAALAALGPGRAGCCLKTCTLTSRDAQTPQATGFGSKHPAPDLNPQPFPLIASRTGFAMAGFSRKPLRNPGTSITGEEKTAVTQPLPLPLGMIAIRQFEIQAEKMLPSLQI